MNLSAAYGILAHGLIFGAVASLMLPQGKFRSRAGLIATGIALIAGIAPMTHGIFSMPSVTLLSLAIVQLANISPSPFSYRPALGFLIFGLIFYPFALGFSSFDPYALGYQPWILLAAILPLAIILIWRQQYRWLVILSLDLTAYAYGIFNNLWDALFDPMLILLAFIVVLRHQHKQLPSQRIAN